MKRLLIFAIIISVLLLPSLVSGQNRFMKGISFGAMRWPQANPQFVDYNLKRLREVGVNSIILIIDWYVSNYKDPNIAPWFRDKPGFPNTDWYTPTLYDQEVCDIITKAHESGLTVMLKPHVETLDWYSGGIGRWGLQLNTGNWDALFTSYLNYLSHYARIADSLNVEIFSMGCELESMTHSYVAGLSNPDERWRKMIAEIRKLYKGKLTYSCSFDAQRNETGSSPNNITFWDALDYIGFEIYRGLTQNDLQPSIDKLKSGVRDVFDNFIKPLHIQYGKKVIIPEISYYSFDGVNCNPIGHTDRYPNPDVSPVDLQEQADCYNAVLSTVDDIVKNEDYLDGLFWWSGYLVDPTGDYGWVKDDKYDFLWFKPAEEVLRNFWSAKLISSCYPDSVAIITAGDTLYLGINLYDNLDRSRIRISWFVYDNLVDSSNALMYMFNSAIFHQYYVYDLRVEVSYDNFYLNVKHWAIRVKRKEILLPEVTTTAASSVKSSSATLNGSVNPNGASTTAWFEWGTSITFATFGATTTQSIGSETSAVSLTDSLQNLSPNTTYYYRAAGQNSAGTQRGSIVRFITSAPTMVELVTNEVPTEYSLTQNYPNPFNPSTTIEFSLPRSSYVTLKVFSLLGEEVATLAGQNFAAGSYRVDWNAKGVASGVYLYRLLAGSFVETKKLLLLK